MWCRVYGFQGQGLVFKVCSGFWVSISGFQGFIMAELQTHGKTESSHRCVLPKFEFQASGSLGLGLQGAFYNFKDQSSGSALVFGGGGWDANRCFNTVLQKRYRISNITLQNSFCVFDACTPMTRSEILAMGKKPKMPAPPFLMIMTVRGGAFC